MSLYLRSDYRKPYNRGKFRWKKLNLGSGKTLVSEFYKKTWKVGEWYSAQSKSKDAMKHDIGFHVFTQPTFETGMLTVKVQVDGFNASGKWAGMENETWQFAKIVAVYDSHNKDITSQFLTKTK